MNPLKNKSTVDYTIKSIHEGTIEISIGEKVIGEIRKEQDSIFILTTKSGDRWILSPKIKGAIRPFSMTVTKEDTDKNEKIKQVEILVIDDHLFEHNNKFYMINIAPEGIPMREALLGKRYICRLNKPLYSQLSHIDRGTKSKLRWLRGVPVGELDGLGTEGHRVKITKELKDIAIPLAASCHLMHSTT